MVNQPTKEELAVLADQKTLLLKNSLSQKIISHLAEIERALHATIHEESYPFPEGTFLKAGKISKGEQYQQLPYFILDYPRLFTQKEIFAFRTMLWWGNHFSCTLHLAGEMLENNFSKISANILTEKDLYYCVNDQPWHYHYEPSNYLRVKDLTKAVMEKHFLNHHFVKISNKIPVTHWDEFKSFTLESFARFLHITK